MVCNSIMCINTSWWKICTWTNRVWRNVLIRVSWYVWMIVWWHAWIIIIIRLLLMWVLYIALMNVLNIFSLHPPWNIFLREPWWIIHSPSKVIQIIVVVMRNISISLITTNRKIQQSTNLTYIMGGRGYGLRHISTYLITINTLSTIVTSILDSQLMPNSTASIFTPTTTCFIFMKTFVNTTISTR